MLTAYLVFSILLLVASLVFTTSQNQGKKWMLISLTLLCISSTWLLAHYIRSTDTDLYRNVETHAIEHIGYKFSNTDELRILDAENPPNALFDEEQGTFKIKVDTLDSETPFHITYQDLGKPLLISANSDGSDYKIANDSLPVWNPTEVLDINFSKKRTLSCTYKLGNKNQHIFTFKFRKGTAKDSKTVIDIDTLPKLNIGYPMLDLVEKCFDIELSTSEIEALEETYLIRNTIYTDLSDQPLAPLHVYTGKLLDHADVTINTETLKPLAKEQKIALKDKSYFYFGIGKNQTEKLQLRFQKQRSTLAYKSHVRYPLYFNDSLHTAELLIATSVDDIIKSSREYSGVINFEGRSTFNNIHHINASIKYAIEDGQTQLNAIKIDNNSGELKIEKITQGKPFLLKTNTKAVDYIVQIKNYNENLLTRWYWLPFLILFISAILFYFFINAYKSKLGFSGRKDVIETKVLNAIKIEYTMYWVMTTFLSVRIYLLWRMYAFPPLEDITYLEFTKLQNMVSFKWTCIGLCAFLSFRAIYFCGKILDISITDTRFSKYILNKVNTLKDFIDKISSKSSWKKIAIYTGIYVGIWFSLIVFLYLVRSVYRPAFIVSSILLPLFCFIFIDSKMPENPKAHILVMLSKRFLNLAAYIGVYFLFDKGFMLVALTVGAFYFVIKNVYFLFKHKKKERSKYLTTTLISSLAFCFIFFAHFIIPKIPGIDNLGEGRIAARGKIIYTSPGEMLLEADFESNRARRILWASESHWFANNHLYERIKNKANYDFPKIRTQYNSRGVSLTVQTREFVVLRYLIFEHNIWVPLLLIAHFLALLLLVGYYYYPKKNLEPSNYFKALGAISLFLILSIIMYLVSINRVIFIGQDFPFLTLTGRAAIIIPFALFCYIMYHINYEDLEYVQEKTPVGTRFMATGLIVFLFAMIGLKTYYVHSKMDDPEMITHEATQPVERLKGFVDMLNTNFKNAQIEYKSSKKLTSLNYKHIPEILDQFLGNTEKIRIRNIDAMINEYTEDEKDANYLKSALKSFNMDEAKNLEHILHIRKKRYADQFEFVVNNSYYRIKPIFESSKDNPNWSGDLLAMETPNQYYFQPVQQQKRVSATKKGQLVDRRANIYEPIALDKKLFGKAFAESKLVKLYRVPSKWLFTEDDAIVAKISNQRKAKRITLSNRTRIYKEQSTRGFSDFILNNGDILKTEDYRPLRVSYNFENYLALNYNYNGKQRFFYPLGKGMIWAYNYSKLLEKNYEQKDPKEAQRSTFDYHLQQDLYDIAINKKLHDNFFVTVLDGHGNVRAMFDYNRGKENYKINPNDYRKLNKIYKEIYFNTRQEDLTLGTRNIRKMNASGGFGSTIKPIVYSAMTSQKRLNWNSIIVHNINNSEIFTKPKKNNQKGMEVTYFGKEKLSTPWLEATGEFNEAPINNKTYITKSRNTYNGVMMLLGSYTGNDLTNYTEELLRPDNKKIDMKERFPRLLIDKKYYVLSEDFYEKLPKDVNPDDFILKTGLRENFDFDVSLKKINFAVDSSLVIFNSKNKINTFHKTDSLFTKAIRNSNFNYQWVFPEKQAFIKNVYNNAGEDIRKNIINPAKGGSPFELTQLGMVENVLRLYTLNPQLKASVQERKDSIAPTMNFAISDDWTDESYTDFIKKNIYSSMHDVPSIGTARGVFGAKNTFEVENSVTKEKVTFYVYAKTGTHNSKKENINDKSLYIIISDIDLSKDNVESTPKLYAMLLTINSVHNSEYQKIQKELFNVIIQSESFKLYYNL